jgi:hypothetical protein
MKEIKYGPSFSCIPILEGNTRQDMGFLEAVSTPGSAERTRASDGVQCPLRSRFPPRLKRSVDMTSDVKGREQLF